MGSVMHGEEPVSATSPYPDFRDVGRRRTDLASEGTAFRISTMRWLTSSITDPALNGKMNR